MAKPLTFLSRQWMFLQHVMPVSEWPGGGQGVARGPPLCDSDVGWWVVVPVPGRSILWLQPLSSIYPGCTPFLKKGWLCFKLLLMIELLFTVHLLSTKI